MNKEVCLKCGGTGITVDGTPCDCRTAGKVELPIVLEVPSIYQNIEFSASLVPMNMSKQYGIDLESIVDVVKSRGSYPSNLLICSPPNTGKTVFAYTIYKYQYVKGLPMPELIDLIEARDLLYSNSYDDNITAMKSKLISSPIAIIKIPRDLPNKFADTMSSIIERRVRKNGNTIFLFGGSINDLYNQDRFNVLKSIIRDGSYNSLKVMSYWYKESDSIES